MNRETRIFIMGLIYASIGVAVLAYYIKELYYGTWVTTPLNVIGFLCGIYLSIKGLRMTDKSIQ